MAAPTKEEMFGSGQLTLLTKIRSRRPWSTIPVWCWSQPLVLVTQCSGLTSQPLRGRRPSKQQQPDQKRKKGVRSGDASLESGRPASICGRMLSEQAGPPRTRPRGPSRVQPWCTSLALSSSVLLQPLHSTKQRCGDGVAPSPCQEESQKVLQRPGTKLVVLCVRTLYTTIHYRHRPIDAQTYCPNAGWPLALGLDHVTFAYWCSGCYKKDEKFLHILLNENSELF